MVDPAFQIHKDEPGDIMSSSMASDKQRSHTLPAANAAPHLKVTSLASRLPPEIMGHIFELYLAQPPGSPHLRIATKGRRLHRLDAKSTRVLLSLVCSTWRDIVDSHPRLWSDVTIRLRRRKPFNSMALCEEDSTGLQRSLQRIGGCLWALHLDFRSLSTSSCEVVHTQPVGSPLSEVLRLSPQSLGSLRFLHTCGEERLTSLGSLTIPSVESLLMERDCTMLTRPPTKQDELDLPQLPGLKKVAFVDVDLITLPPHFPWGTLTHIYLESATTAEALLLILQSCPELQEASFQGGVTRSNLQTRNSTQARAQRTTLDRLSRIQFRNAPFHLDFTGISWPNLTRMQIQTSSPILGWHDKNWPLFHSLTHLHISSGWESTGFPISTLDRWCPHLTHLVLNPSIPMDYTQLFRDLSFARPDHHFPHLEVLGVNMEDTLLEPYGWASDVGMSNLVDMVVSRCDQTTVPSRLRKLVLRIDSRQWDAARDNILFSPLGKFKESTDVVVIGKTRCRYHDATFDGEFTEWECDGLRELTESFTHFRYSFTYENT